MQTKMFLPFLLALMFVAYLGCTSSDSDKKSDNQTADIDKTRQLEKDELIARGAYLVTIAGCNDCHTPKVFSERGMSFDSTRLLSGHPADEPMFAVRPEALRPDGYIQMSPGLTAFAGPWGISYPANLTPDSTTGLGGWTEDVFMKTLRTGKHLGQPDGRDILPPMPWFNLVHMTDEDLSAVYNYLRSIPAVNNKVPAPVPPNQVKVTP